MCVPLRISAIIIVRVFNGLTSYMFASRRIFFLLQMHLKLANCLRFASPASAIRQSRSRLGVSSDIGILFGIGNGNQSRIVSKSFVYVDNLSKIHWKLNPNRLALDSISMTSIRIAWNSLWSAPLNPVWIMSESISTVPLFNFWNTYQESVQDWPVTLSSTETWMELTLPVMIF